MSKDKELIFEDPPEEEDPDEDFREELAEKLAEEDEPESPALVDYSVETSDPEPEGVIFTRGPDGKLTSYRG